ncbi:MULTISPECIES: hypothetical protein [Roseomonadaceae]|uniref:Uncharacterized protein n=1 Tax=Falsiroseomonas oleicola TaxID=2801474 RepID=A0ABS6HD96_9PROT|nr:hypothetical protein [Roseomonas oleicola]MBU8545787.1 hypothetical protein [Roseomonas oleicola]
MFDTALITAAAQRVATTEAVASAAAARRVETAQAADRLRHRLSALTVERAAIVTRRAGGERLPDDGATLALIEADRDGLRDMLAEAEAASTEAKQRAEAADATASAARDQLALAENEEMLRRLVAHATEMDRVLLETMKQLRDLGAKLGISRPMWAPSMDLGVELRRLLAAAGRL